MYLTKTQLDILRSWAEQTPQVQEAYLFGSYAKGAGDHRAEGINDFVLAFNRSLSFGKPSLRVGKIARFQTATPSPCPQIIQALRLPSDGRDRAWSCPRQYETHAEQEPPLETRSEAGYSS
jgi:hypothetical protein